MKRGILEDKCKSPYNERGVRRRREQRGRGMNLRLPGRVARSLALPAFFS